jgi:hypothetical protein
MLGRRILHAVDLLGLGDLHVIFDLCAAIGVGRPAEGREEYERDQDGEEADPPHDESSDGRH